MFISLSIIQLMAESILITGGCGFAGSNLALFLKKRSPAHRIIAFDNLRRRGSELNISRLHDAGVEFIHGDVRNEEDFYGVGEITALVEASAEASVLSGIDASPRYVINTNLAGAVHCLDFAQKHNAKFIFLSTSRVYPVASLNQIQYTEGESRFEISSQQILGGVTREGISERFPLEGARSFYGASKLAAELMIKEYAEYNGLPCVVNRCGVLAGPWQMGKMDQGVIVLWLARHFWKKELNYIGFGGEGKQVRDVLHIDDLCHLVHMQLNDISKFNNQVFNVGGGRDVSVSLKELTAICQELTGNKISIGMIAENRAADVPIYISDSSKIYSLSGWCPQKTLMEILQETFHWLKMNEASLKNILA